MKAPAKSVPPEMLFHQMSGRPMPANCAVPQLCTSGDSGEPVVPRLRMRDRSPHWARSTPAFMQLV